MINPTPILLKEFRMKSSRGFRKSRRSKLFRVVRPKNTKVRPTICVKSGSNLGSPTCLKVVCKKLPTQNTAAYDAYLRGLAIEHTQYGYEAYQQAARDYVEAVQLDPNFSFAWARLAVLRSFLYFNAVDPNTNTAGAVKEAADRAMALAPEAGESWIAQGAYRYRVLRDFAGAVTAYKQAQIRLPNNSYLLQNLAFVQRRLGLWQEAEATFKKALELDPRDFQLLGSIGGELYTYLRR